MDLDRSRHRDSRHAGRAGPEPHDGALAGACPAEGEGAATPVGQRTRNAARWRLMCLTTRPPYHPERSEGPAVFRHARKRWHYLHVLVVAAVVAFGAQASDTAHGARYQKLSHAMMCPCGCNQLLGECNHVGCTYSDKMRSQLAASIDHGDDDTTIFHAFQDEYGPTALAAPMFTHFNQFSWWVPPVL